MEATNFEAADHLIKVSSKKRTYIIDYKNKYIIMTNDSKYDNIPTIERSVFKIERFIDGLVKDWNKGKK